MPSDPAITRSSFPSRALLPLPVLGLALIGLYVWGSPESHESPTLLLLGNVFFTTIVALFIAALAFESSQLLEAAKLSTLLASLIAGLIGFLLLSRTPVATR